MKVYEFTGKTTEEAIDTGLTQLGLHHEDVHVDILQEGAKGLFGLFGSKPAKVRITVEEQVKEEEDLGIHWSIDEEKPQPKKQKKPEREKQEPRKLQEAPKAEAPAAAKAETPKQQAEAKPEPEAKQAPAQENAETVQTEKAPEQEKPRKERRPRDRKVRAAKPKQERPEVRREPMAPAVPFQPTEAPVLFEEGTPAGIAQRFLMEITEKMGVQVDVYVDECREDAVSLRVIGDTLGILIGHRGETLDALQYLTSLQVNKGRDEYIRVTLDTENYRAKREDSLRRLALRMANRAQKTGRRVVMEPMNPYERRVMHTALQDHPAVTTHSEGEEPNRRVVITLKAAQAPEEEESREAGKADEAGQPAKRKRNRHRSRKPKNRQEAAPETAAEESAPQAEAPAVSAETEE
ncbi:MAG: Jag N-terminal domain-containing protein [Clostridia bacterium]|nr:Jag N-terminal domain-containing protein [Clostridia bacterium]